MGRLGGVSRPFSTPVFTVRQAATGMKVGFDAILLGALSGRAFAAERDRRWRVLDVGCGSGIVGLLQLQAADAAGARAWLTSIDIDADAAQQARSNAASSPWPASITVLQSSLQEFAAHGHPSFDLVVCNPPYYPRPAESVQARLRHQRATQAGIQHENQLPVAADAPDFAQRDASLPLWSASRGHARFSEYLPAAELVAGVAALLTRKGRFWCIYPNTVEPLVQREAAASGLVCTKRVEVVFKRGAIVRRVVLEFVPNEAAMDRGTPSSEAAGLYPEEQTVVVREDDTHYTDEFIALAQQYYAVNLAALPSVVTTDHP